MLYEYSLVAPREDFYNITPQLREAVAKSGVVSGHAIIYCPHTTAELPSMRTQTRMSCGTFYWACARLSRIARSFGTAKETEPPT